MNKLSLNCHYSGKFRLNRQNKMKIRNKFKVSNCLKFKKTRGAISRCTQRSACSSRHSWYSWASKSWQRVSTTRLRWKSPHCNELCALHLHNHPSLVTYWWCEREHDEYEVCVEPPLQVRESSLSVLGLANVSCYLLVYRVCEHFGVDCDGWHSVDYQ
jgi:hypothetical protein